MKQGSATQSADDVRNEAMANLHTRVVGQTSLLWFDPQRKRIVLAENGM